MSRADELATDFCLKSIPVCVLNEIASRDVVGDTPLQSIAKFLVFMATIALIGWVL